MATSMDNFFTRFETILENQQKVIEAFMEFAKPKNDSTPTHVPVFPKFDRSNNTWDVFKSQIDQHFVAYNMVKAEDKRAFFLSWMGAELFELLQKLCDAARFQFFRTTLKANQNYADWIAELRGIARNCSFICNKEQCTNPYVDNLIRDVIVLNTPHDQVRNAALQKANPTLEDIQTIAETFEATKIAVHTITGNSTECQGTVQQLGVVQHVKKYPSQNAGIQKSKPVKQKGKYNEKVQGEQKADNNICCESCGSNHPWKYCKFRKARCRGCGRLGHIVKDCKQKEDRVQLIESVFMVAENNGIKRFGNKFFVTIKVNGISLDFQLDTGATCSMVGEAGYEALGRPICCKTNKLLKGYGDHQVPLRGALSVKVKLDAEEITLPLLVTKAKEGSNILGIDWFDKLKFCVEQNVNQVCEQNLINVNYEDHIKEICEKFKEVFDSQKVGQCTDFKATLVLKPDAKPKYFKPRPIPFALVHKVKAELNRLIEAGILKPIACSQWAAPIVIVEKPNGNIRICGDFKVTVNSQIETERYSLPSIDEIFHRLKRGKIFTKLDLSEAYFQLELDEKSKKLMVINTVAGLLEYQRMPYGVSSGPAIFQKLMEAKLSQIKNTAVYIDDIIIAGETFEEHMLALNEVLNALKNSGLNCNLKKSQFFQTNIEYLGHVISAKGIEPNKPKVQAIEQMPRPRNIKEVQAFLGKVNYYNKFLDRFSEYSKPLNNLRRKGAPFKWDDSCEKSFQLLKTEIIKATNLVHFNDKLPLLLATDASSYGISAVLSHRFPDETEHPIAHASKTLNKSQGNYSQIENEALSIIFGVQKFHQFVYGRKFELFTDHKPLISIFHPHHRLPVMTVQRLQRWAIILMAYDYMIRYKPTEKHGNADCLSRLPQGPDLVFDEIEQDGPETTLQLEEITSNLPVLFEDVQKQTNRDKILQKVIKFVTEGWPERNSDSCKEFKTFFNRRLAISIHKGVLLIQTDYTRVIIPTTLRKIMLQMLHEGHWGSVRMKQMARHYCWWPDIDKNIEETVACCTSCQENSSSSHKVFESWPLPTEPWQRIHLDFLGPFMESMYLVCMDAFSKFPYIVKMNSTTTTATVRALKNIFVIEGLPTTIVSDNGPQFTSEEFRRFCSENGICHLTSAPFHPASNGEAERCVRTFKTALRKICSEGINQDEGLLKFLITYRTTPANNNKSPAEILHGRQPRILLELIKPHKANTNELKSISKFQIDQPVYTKSFSRGPKWIHGRIQRQIGSNMYCIKLSQTNQVIRRHQNQIRRAPEQVAQDNHDYQLQPTFVSPTILENAASAPSCSSSLTRQQPGQAMQSPIIIQDSSSENELSESEVGHNTPSSSQSQSPRRSTRSRRPPQCYSP
ncbi:uncharacterized protein K02A2.6-like isoform X2 [Episyrphus balteatus]|uniref:uncharacterized protein K02A2.6-like isoform X2 n=1 Tax=Episyrphus balteatus TaxID=286459 RepID=UPI002486BF9D|nr:uncharacterized protein K02A2.6-like isoform X2 [Episyrphus balteatus]